MRYASSCHLAQANFIGMFSVCTVSTCQVKAGTGIVHFGLNSLLPCTFLSCRCRKAMVSTRWKSFSQKGSQQNIRSFWHCLLTGSVAGPDKKKSSLVARSTADRHLLPYIIHMPKPFDLTQLLEDVEKTVRDAHKHALVPLKVWGFDLSFQAILLGTGFCRVGFQKHDSSTFARGRSRLARV